MRYSWSTGGQGAVEGIDRAEGSLWLCSIGDEVSVEVDRCCHDVLSAQRCVSWAAFRFATHRRQYLHSHYFLRCVLSTQTGVDPAQLRFSTDLLGKPWLDGGSLNFNLSHTSGVAACCASAGSLCGVDVERHRPLPDMDLVAERNFSVAERTLLGQATSGTESELFFRIWTLKEAYIKALGVGLSVELTTFSVLPRQDGIGEVRHGAKSAPRTASWSVYWWEFADGFHVAAAFSGRVDRPRITMIKLEDLVTNGGYYENAH